MEPFYLLVFIAGLLIANVLLQLLRLAGGGRGALYFERQPRFLGPEERLCLSTIEEAVGTDFRVFAKVALRSVLQPDERRRHRRARASALLAGRMLDFLVCSAADGYPLCAVLARPQQDGGRSAKREQKLIADACASAGLPMITLPLQDRYEVNLIRRQVLDAVETADVRVAQTPEAPAADEEALLAELVATIQEPEGIGGRRISGSR